MALRCAHGHTLWSSGTWVRTSCLSPTWIWLLDCFCQVHTPKVLVWLHNFLTQEATSATRRCATSSLPTSVASSLCMMALPAGAAQLPVGKRLAAYELLCVLLQLTCNVWQGNFMARSSATAAPFCSRLHAMQ